jgi:penicillin amidase
MKTAHGTTRQRHTVRYGSNARHISDLSDMDRNDFVLLGGQDGWLNSTTFLDQVPLWLEARYIRLPLRPETVQARSVHRMDLRPAEGR